MITQQRVRQLFKYQDGKLVRRVRLSHNAQAGDVAGRADSSGYLQTAVGKVRYFNHSLIWLYHYGYLPQEIDHINKNRKDNRIENLREVSRQENAMNLSRKSGNKSGVPGVFWHKRKKRWTAYISYGKQMFHLGAFDSFDEAICHRLAAEQCLGFTQYNKESPAHLYVKDHILNTRSR